MRPAPPIQGFHDLGPAEVRHLADVRGALVSTFYRADYLPIDVPLIEPLDLYLQKYGAQVLPHVYSFVDQAKREVALRPEFTPSVIRALSAQAAAGSAIRVSYDGPVFRYEPPEYAVGRQFTQAGVELLGEPAPGADAEIVALACAAARAAGLPRLQVVLGHLGPVREVLRSLEIDGYAEQFLLEHLEYFHRGAAQRRIVRERLGLAPGSGVSDHGEALSTSLADAVREAEPGLARKQVAAMLEQMGLDLRGSTRSPEEIIERMIAKARRQALSRDGAWKARLERALSFVEALGSLRGEPEQTLARADALLRQYSAALHGLDDMRRIVDALRTYDLAGAELILAPGMARGIAYYSGLIFELFAHPGDNAGAQPVPLCGGGRYDGLVHTLTGHAIPALGFAFDVERLLDAIPNRAPSARAPRLAVCVLHPDLWALAHRTAACLRSHDLVCRVEEGSSDAAALSWAGAQGFDAAILLSRQAPHGDARQRSIILRTDAPETLAAQLEAAIGQAEQRSDTAAIGAER